MEPDVLDQIHRHISPAAARWYRKWRRNPANLDEPADSLMSALAEAMGNEQAQSRVDRFLTRARLKREVCSHALWRRPGLSLMAQYNLCDGGWMEAGHNLILLGAPQIGKTFLAGAIARSTLARTASVQWLDLPHHLDRWDGLMADQIGKKLTPYRNAKLLVIDGFTKSMVPREATAALARLMESRVAGQRPTIFEASRPLKDWDTLFADEVAARKLFDQVLTRSKRITIKAPDTSTDASRKQPRKRHRRPKQRCQTPSLSRAEP